MAKAVKKINCIALLMAALMLCACSQTPAEPQEEPQQSPAPEITVPVEISEVMASNKSTLDDGSGTFPDWLELHNTGDEPVALDGYWLVCGKDRWQIPQLSLEPGEYTLIFCAKEAIGSGLYAAFGISAKGEELSLESPGGTVADYLQLPQSQVDVSFVRDEDGGLVPALYATPGYENSADGYAAFQASLVNDSPLQINEVMVYNEWFLPQGEEYYDWVELKNVSDEPLELSGYAISDKSGQRLQLPAQTLDAGEVYVLLCTGGEAEGAPFSLNAEEERLFLWDDEGLCDYAHLSGLRYGGSYGRLTGENGFFYFNSPTPGEENQGGERRIAQKPTLLGGDGVFNDVQSVTVQLEAPGEIYYTLDGSCPDTASQRYTGPITLDETTVLRAVQLEDGALVSDSLDLSFIINEGHTLPVVSMVIDPEDIFGAQTGIYTHAAEDWERRGSISLFEEGKSFTIGCGIKLHGATSKIAQEKKSFKIKFLSRYDGQLHYDLFENGVTDFSSILLRAAQESHFSTLMRDNLMHQVAIETFPELPAQDYKYAVLYINGEYRGIYNIREAHSEEHYANHYGYDADTVVHWKEAWDKYSSTAQLYDFIMDHDMRSDENYAYAASQLNIESIIGWTILQGYSSNFDINSPNMRFYYSYADNKTAYALVDLDLGMFDTEGLIRPLYFGYMYNNLVARLATNEQFRQQLIEAVSEALKGPLSDEGMLERIDALAAEIRPEIPRDGELWGCSLKAWEHEIEGLKSWVTRNGGRAARFVNDVCSTLHLSQEEREQYFGEIIAQK